MTPQEAAALLAVAAAFDNRKPDADAAMAWSMALDAWRFQDCRDAIVAHYRVTREWIMPSDIIAAVKTIRRDRLRDYGPIEPPAELDPNDQRAYADWLHATQKAIADGEQPPSVADVQALEKRPMPDFEILMPGIAPVPPAKKADYQAKLAAARAELAARRSIPTPEDAALADDAEADQ